MQSGPVAEAVGLGVLVVVLGFAMARPRGWPEALVAVPAAAVVVALGMVSPERAWDRAAELGPTLAFLAAVLVIAHLVDLDGVFAWLGAHLARGSRGDPRRLLGLTFAAAAATTAVLSLDATAVLLTPVVVVTARRLGLPAGPHVYATAHLANSASTLLPVSNLTNLLVFGATGLGFLGFTALMAGPWLVTLALELLVFRRYFAADLDPRPSPPTATPGPAPRFALGVLAATLVGFCAGPVLHVDAVHTAVAAAVVLGVRAVATRRTGWRGIVGAAAPLLCLFVAALAVVVEAVTEAGGRDLLVAVLPAGTWSTSLPGLLAVAGIAALLANLVNNLPATLMLLSVLGPHAHPGVLLAVLLGVNIGPNLTYVGSLATLLWRRVVTAQGVVVRGRDFLALGVLTVPVCLVAATTALWAALRLAGLA